MHLNAKLYEYTNSNLYTKFLNQIFKNLHSSVNYSNKLLHLKKIKYITFTSVW